MTWRPKSGRAHFGASRMTNGPDPTSGISSGAVVGRNGQHSPEELTNESTLEGSLDGMSIVVTTHEGNGLIGWYARQHRHACQGRAGPSAPSTASDLDPRMSGACVGIHQRVDGLAPIAR